MILELTRCYKITGILKTMQLLFCYNFNQNAYDPFYEKKHDHYFYGRQMDREIFKLRQIR